MNGVKCVVLTVRLNGASKLNGNDIVRLVMLIGRVRLSGNSDIVKLVLNGNADIVKFGMN